MSVPVAARVAWAVANSNELRSIALWTAALLVAAFTGLVWIVVALVQSVLGFNAAGRELGFFPDAVTTMGAVTDLVPVEDVARFQDTAAQSTCGMPWPVVAAMF